MSNVNYNVSKKYKCDVSVAVINYNRFKYIDRAIRSCLDQNLSFKTHEVIVVDDHSTDNSRKIMEDAGVIVKGYDDTEKLKSTLPKVFKPIR